MIQQDDIDRAREYGRQEMILEAGKQIEYWRDRLRGIFDLTDGGSLACTFRETEERNRD